MFINISCFILRFSITEKKGKFLSAKSGEDITFVSEKSDTMKIGAANIKINEIIAKVEKEGIQADGLIQELKDLREFGLKEKDPLVTKVIRLTYEYLEENGSFDVEAQYEEEEDGGEYPLEIEDKENLLYLLNLLLQADHKINREEIKDYRTALKEALY